MDAYSWIILISTALEIGTCAFMAGRMAGYQKAMAKIAEQENDDDDPWQPDGEGEPLPILF
ncbi:MAG: hypothetical protein WAX89_02760 [Alphaproteobacteria bacterium]